MGGGGIGVRHFMVISDSLKVFSFHEYHYNMLYIHMIM